MRIIFLPWPPSTIWDARYCIRDGLRRISYEYYFYASPYISSLYGLYFFMTYHIVITHGTWVLPIGYPLIRHFPSLTLVKKKFFFFSTSHTLRHRKNFFFFFF